MSWWRPMFSKDEYYRRHAIYSTWCHVETLSTFAIPDKTVQCSAPVSRRQSCGWLRRWRMWGSRSTHSWFWPSTGRIPAPHGSSIRVRVRREVFQLEAGNYSIQSSITICIVTQLVDQLGGDQDSVPPRKNLHFWDIFWKHFLLHVWLKVSLKLLLLLST